MSDKVREITDDKFKEEIAAGVVLVDFWAPWCGPCRTQAPILDTLAERFGSRVAIRKINVDDNQGVATELGIRSIPTLILYKNGEEVKRFVSLQQEAALAEALEGAAG